MYDNLLIISHEVVNNFISFKNKIENNYPPCYNKRLINVKNIVEKPKLIKNIVMILTMKTTKAAMLILKKNIIYLIIFYIIRTKFQLN